MKSEFTVRKWNDSIERSTILKIMNSYGKALHQDYKDRDEDVLDVYLGKNGETPKDFLVFENSSGEIVGFVVLTNYAGNLNYYFLWFGILEDCFDSTLPKKVVDEAISLAQLSSLNEIFLLTDGTNSIFDQILENQGYNPFHYMWTMKLTEYPKPLENANLSTQKISILMKEELEDYDEFVSVANQAHEGQFNDTKISKEQFREVISVNRNYYDIIFLLAKEREALCGYILCFIEKTKSEVGKIAGFGLLSNYRNKGIGSTLMRRALDHFQTKGVKQALITVNGENPKAMKLYQKFGFKVVEDSTKNYYRIK